MSIPPYPATPIALPPDPPELPEGVDPRPRWPAWFAPVGFAAAFGLVLLVSTLLIGVAAAVGDGDLEDPPSWVTIAGTVLQGAIFVGTAVMLAATVARPRPWHFGLRRSRFWPTVGWAALGMFSFYVFAAAYSAVVQPEGQQDVAEDLGAKDGTLALVAGAFVVVVVAPIAEEVFFRGFLYRALRNRFGIWVAAAIAGAVFGSVHFTGPDSLSILPILAVLGVVFCLVYERTGSLYPVIALHAFNNTIAYSVELGGETGPAVAAGLGLAMIAGCVLMPRYAWRRAPALR